MRRGAKYDEQVSIQGELVPNQVGHREKRTSVRAKKGNDASISSPESTRILRSRTQEKPKQPEPPIIMNSAENGDSKKRKKKVQAENVAVDEFSRLRRNMSYVVNRIKYEQALIDAYSAEGWKKQSLEKIRPERELQRAKSEIFRRKSVIRDLFLRIDQMCNEGVKIPKTSSDSTGEIDSDDLCCSKCGSKEFPANKDIIICDGCCERGFHLNCLEPPILKKDLHLYADNWLCPACDCKFDCIDLVNDLHKADLSMTDSWEKVFPETVKNQDEDSGLPSDDDDLNPDSPVSDEKVGESNDSSKALPNEDPYLGLPSDDSEDDDFNPIVEDVEGDDVKKESSSSDFTSDSEDFSVALHDDNEQKLSEDEQQVSSKSNDNEEEEDDTGVISAKRNVERLDYKKLHDEEYGSGTSDSSDDDYMDNSIEKNNNSVKKKRGKKVSSGSPDNEDLAVNPSESKSTPKRRISKKVDVEGMSKSPSNGKSKSTPRRRISKKVDVEETSKSPSNGKSKSTSKSTKKRLGQAVTKEESGSVSSDSNDEDYMDNNIKNNTSGKKKRGKKVSSVSSDNNEDLTVNPGESKTTPKRSITQQLALEGTSKSPSNGKSTSNSKSTNRRLGEAVTKRLYEYFNENQYPDVATKESLAKEVGITAHQVNKWFMNTRWSYNHPSAKRSKTQNNNNGT